MNFNIYLSLLKIGDIMEIFGFNTLLNLNIFVLLPQR